MPQSIGIWQIVLIIVLVLILFGARKLPELAKGLGQSLRVFNSEMKKGKEDENEDADSGPKSKNGDAPDDDR